MFPLFRCSFFRSLLNFSDRPVMRSLKKCRFCRMKFASKEAGGRHVKVCVKNPESATYKWETVIFFQEQWGPNKRFIQCKYSNHLNTVMIRKPDIRNPDSFENRTFFVFNFKNGRFCPVFEWSTISCLIYFEPFKNRTCPVFRSPLYYRNLIFEWPKHVRLSNGLVFKWWS